MEYRGLGQGHGDPKMPAGKLFAAWFVLCEIVRLVVLGVAVWAVITLVQHFAG